MNDFLSVLNQVKNCQLCASNLPHDPNPVIQIQPSAKILIAGQAPGKKVHESGKPFDDASGQRLRQWLGLSNDQFYNPNNVAILPMGLCYPGRGRSGDLPPRRECAPAWREQLLSQLNQIELTIVLGKYAHQYHFKDNHQSVTDLVKSWKTYWPNKVPLPHPSPRNNIWLSQNRWFEAELVPQLQKQVARLLFS